MNQLLKLILAGILILCFLKLPFLYYRFSGYVLFAGFGWLAYDAFQRRDHLDAKIFVIMAILYNPFFTFPFPNFLWVLINITVIVGLILNILFAQENPYEDQIKKDDR